MTTKLKPSAIFIVIYRRNKIPPLKKLVDVGRFSCSITVSVSHDFLAVIIKERRHKKAPPRRAGALVVELKV